MAEVLVKIKARIRSTRSWWDRLQFYCAALKDIGKADRQETRRWLTNRAENSHWKIAEGKGQCNILGDYEVCRFSHPFDRIILIAADTDGIGLVIARTLSVQGHTLLLPVHNEDKFAVVTRAEDDVEEYFCAYMSDRYCHVVCRV